MPPQRRARPFSEQNDLQAHSPCVAAHRPQQDPNDHFDQQRETTMQNTICLTGRLTRDPEQKSVSGKSLTTAAIAVNKKFKKDGQKDADFFELAIWGQQGDFLVNYGQKGRLIAVSGRMESRDYNDNDGNKRTAWTVNVSEVSILDRPKEGDSGEPGGTRMTATARSANQTGSGNPSTTIDEYDPFADE
jgi:single-strand DNA-binding protein